MSDKNDLGKNIDLGNAVSKGGFKVIKGNSPITSAEKPTSLCLDSTNIEHRESNIGLDLLANPQKKRADNETVVTKVKSVQRPAIKSPDIKPKLPEKPTLFKVPEGPPSRQNYQEEAELESLVDKQDLFQSTMPRHPSQELDKLSFVSTISSKKSNKKVHHFDLNSDNLSSGGRNQDSQFNNIPGTFKNSSSLDSASQSNGIELNITKEPMNFNNSSNSQINSNNNSNNNFTYPINNDIMEQMERASSYSSEVEPPPKKLTFEEIKREKEELIYKFEKMRRLGMNIPKRFNMTSDLEEMKVEFEKVKRDREVENGIKFSRKVLMAITTGMEFLNNKFDPCDLKLDGWSESVHENIGEYDEVFEELNEKYKGTAKVSPEIKLLLMLGGSGFMFHLTNTMFKSSLPGMGDIMKQNPDLMKQFASVALNTMNEDHNSVGGRFNQSGSGGMSGMGGMGGMGNNSQNIDSNFLPNQNPFQNGNPVKQAPQRREMRGPTGVDEILQEFQNEQADNTSMTSSQFERKMMDRTGVANNDNSGNRRQFSLNM